MQLRHLALIATLAVGAACSDDSPLEPATPLDAAAGVPASAAKGLAVFTTTCGTCHTSRDGFDLALFGFSDRDIVRRAVHHVDTAAALQILRQVRSLRVTPLAREHRPFQVPRVATDLEFAQALFGADQWPRGTDEAALLRIDPAKVAAAVTFPRWSEERSDLDWMANAPLPDAVLQHNDRMAQRALEAYYADRTEARLVSATSRLRAAVFDSATGACAQVHDGALAAPLACFEQLRWISTLGAQHVLRRGASAAALPAASRLVQNTWWDVGQAARRSLIKNKVPVPQAEANWVSWMYLGWVLAPSDRASVYTASGLNRVGLPRHATFVAMRSLVARPAASPNAYADLKTAVQFAPMGWLDGVATTALTVLTQRQARGWAPTSEMGRSDAKASLTTAGTTLVRRLGTAMAAPLVARIEALAAAL